MTVGTRKVVVTVGTEVVEAGATQKIVVDMGSLPESELEKRSAQTGHMDTDFPPLPRAVQVGRRTFAAHSLEEIELLSERSEEFVGLWPFCGTPTRICRFAWHACSDFVFLLVSRNRSDCQSCDIPRSRCLDCTCIHLS